MQLLQERLISEPALLRAADEGPHGSRPLIQAGSRAFCVAANGVGIQIEKLAAGFRTCVAELRPPLRWGLNE